MSMLRNLATSLINSREDRIVTTMPKAKELRPFVERLITVAKRGLSDGAANARELNARRLVMVDVQDREVVTKLFDTLAPRFAERQGGYTRLLRLGFRRGDSAEVAQVELLGSEFNPRAKAEGDAKSGEKPKSPSRPTSAAPFFTTPPVKESGAKSGPTAATSAGSSAIGATGGCGK